MVATDMVSGLGSVMTAASAGSGAPPAPQAAPAQPTATAPNAPTTGPANGAGASAGDAMAPALVHMDDWSKLIFPVYDSSQSNLFSELPTINHRFPGISGRPLWHIISRHYLLPTKVHPLVANDWFDRDRNCYKRLLTRAKVNDRGEAETRNRYKASIRQHGFEQEGRSKVVVIRTQDCAHLSERRLLAAAHLVEALYENYEEDCEALSM
jgi:hypothetical protein